MARKNPNKKIENIFDYFPKTTMEETEKMAQQARQKAQRLLDFKKKFKEDSDVENRLEILKQMREGKMTYKSKKKISKTKKGSRMWHFNGQMVLGDWTTAKTLRGNKRAAKEKKERDKMVNQILGIDNSRNGI